MSARRRVLIVDDDAPIRDLLLVALADEGYEVIEAGDGVAVVAQGAVHVVLQHEELVAASQLDEAATLGLRQRRASRRSPPSTANQ